MAWQKLSQYTPSEPTAPPSSGPTPPPTGNWKKLSQLSGVTPGVTHPDGYGELGDWEHAYDLLLNRSARNMLVQGAVGVASGVEIAGALTELVFPQWGETLRQSGISAQDWIKQAADPDWQASADKLWATRDPSKAAWADYRSYLAGLSQVIPMMIGTGGAGGVAELGVAGAARYAGKSLSKEAARKIGYGGAAAVAGGGEAAGEAIQAAEQAGLPRGQQRLAGAIAAPIGAVGGAALGLGLEHITGEAVGAGVKAFIKRGVVGTLAEGGDEGMEAVGTETGKAAVGLEFSGQNILESTIGGAILGGPAGAAIGHHTARQQAKVKALKDAETQATAELNQKELERIKAEDAQTTAAAAQAAQTRDTAAAGLLSQAQAIAEKQRMAAIRRINPNMPLPMGERAPGGGPVVGQGATQEALQQPESRAIYIKEEGRQNLARLDEEVVNIKKQLDEIRAEIEGTPAMKQSERAALGTKVKRVSINKRVKLKAQFKELTKEHDALVTRRNKFATTMTRMVEEHDPEVNADAIQQAELDELNTAISNTIGEQEDTPAPDPDPTSIIQLDQATIRSQRASAAAVTRRANRAAAETPEVGPGAPPVTDNVPAPKPAGGAVVGGSAEKQAIASKSGRARRKASPPSEGLKAAFSAEVPSQAQPGVAAAPPGPATPPPSATAETSGTPAPSPEAVTPAPPPSVAALPQNVPQRGKPQRGVNPAPSTVEITPEEVTSQVTSQTQGPPTPLRVSEQHQQVTPEERDAWLADTSRGLIKPPNPLATTPQQEIPAHTGRVKAWTKQTGVERITKMLRAGPQNVNDLLAAVQDAHNTEKNSARFRLVQKLRRAFPSSRAKPLKTTVEHRTLSAGFQGIYDPVNDKIYLDVNQAEDLETALLHEAVHAATLIRMRLVPDFKQAINILMGKATDQWVYRRWVPDVEQMPGFRTPEEFIAEALTNYQFADKLGVLFEVNADQYGNTPVQARSFYKRLKTLVGARLGFHYEPAVASVFDQLLDFIPDGTFLQEGNRQEAVAELTRLGLVGPVALMASNYRTLMRQHGAKNVLNNNIFNRVWRHLLPTMGVDQIGESYGKVGFDYATAAGNRVKLKYDTVNRYVEFVDRKAGHAKKERALHAQVVEFYKSAVQANGPEPLNNLLYDGRLWDIHPDLPPAGASPPGGPVYSNAPGYNKPGGADAWTELHTRWGALGAREQTAFRLIRDSFARVLDRHINQIMIARMRGLVDTATADRFDAFIHHAGRAISVVHGGIRLDWHKVPTSAEVTAFVTTLPFAAVRKAELVAEINKVTTILGRSTGPYIPLRRTGAYYTHVISDKIQKHGITRAAYDKLLTDNRIDPTQPDRRGPSDIEVLSDKQNANGTWDVDYRHLVVQSFDSEPAAILARQDFEESFRRRSIPVKRAAAKLGIDHTYEALGLQNQSIMALQNEVRQSMPGAAGEEAARVMMKFYLEKLPDTSVRKAQLKTRKVAGASRDMLHVLSSAFQGSSYFDAQMIYGPKLAHIVSTEMEHDFQELHDAGMTAQGNDLAALQKHFVARDTQWNRLASNENDPTLSTIKKLWQVSPQIAGAWMLTGIGTALSNAGQVPILSFPWLSSQHGYGAATKAIWKAYTQVIAPTTTEGYGEFKRFLSGVTGREKFGTKATAGGSVFTKTYKGRPLPTIKDPTTPFFRNAMRNVTDPISIAVIESCADQAQIEFGQTADLQAHAQRAGRGWQLFQYMTDGAHTMMQSVETLNRTVTALASVELNKDQVTARVTSSLPAGTPAPDIQAAVVKELTRLAIKDLKATQFNYGYENRPLLFQKDMLRGAATFKMYPQNMWYRTMHTAIQIFNPNESPAQRWQAAKFLGGMFMMTSLSAGFLGILGFDMFYAAALLLMRGLTDDDDPETMLRRAMHAVNADWAADAALHGVAYGAGVADTGRMGLPTFFPVQDIYKIITKPDSGYKDVTAAIGTFLMGAPGSLASDVAGSYTSLAEGDYAEAFQSMTPKAFGINDAWRAWQLANKGMVDTAGRAYVTPDDTNWRDYVVRFMGFQPAEVSKARSSRNAKLAANSRLDNKRKDLLEKFANAQIGKDYDTRAEALKEIKAFNHQHRAAAITRSSLVSSVQERRRGAKAVAKYGVQATTRSMRRISKEVDQVYGQ